MNPHMKCLGNSGKPKGQARQRGFTLIVVIIVLVFLLSVGMALLSVTGTGTKVADNIRGQDEALNAAEAGFDVAWSQLENSFSFENWTDFDTHYLKEPAGIDLPTDPNYFRKLTDQEIFQLIDPNGDGNPDVPNVLFCKEPYVLTGTGTLRSVLTYTVFLIDDEAGSGVSDASDALMVSIGTVGQGARAVTSRIEVLLSVETSGH